VFAIFWGSNWNGSGAALRGQIMHFYETLSGSSYQGILTQYFDAESRISSNVSVASYTDTSVAAPSGVNDAKIRNEVGVALSANKGWGAQELDDQFVVFTAPGSSFEAGFGGFCGYHGTTGGGGTYSFIPYQGDEPFQPICASVPGFTDPNSLTSETASHEYAESATDPIPTEFQWREYLGEGPEIADICTLSEEYVTLSNGAVVAKLWDNNQNQCSTADYPPHHYAITEPASKTTNTEATLNGLVNPDGGATNYYFQYGTTTSYGSNTGEVSAGSSVGSKAVSQAVSGLAQNTTYHYRTVAVSGGAARYGEDTTFMTLGVPTATTDAPLAVSGTGAILEGDVNPHGVSTTYHFEYGTSEAYGTSVPVPDGSIGGVFESVAESFDVIGKLEPQKTYHYRIVATNAYGTTKGNDYAFTTGTAKLPTITTEGVTNIGASSATMTGKINPNGAETSYYIEYGPTLTYGFKTKETEMGDGSSAKSLFYPYNVIEKLETGESYYARIVATNIKGTVKGESQLFFTTGPSPRNTALPVVSSTSPRQGLMESVTTGTWVGKPTLTYQWQRCNASGGECLNISGAASANYLPVGFDSDHTLVAKVTATNAQGSTFAVSAATSKVQPAFAATPTLSLEFGKSGTGNAQFDAIQGDEVDSEGNVWVADSGNNRLQKFNSKGEFLLKVGSFGTGNGQLSWPTDIAFDAEGNAWVVDQGNNRLQKFNSKGEYLSKLGSKGTGNGQLSEPSAVAIDSAGNIWVTDTVNSRVEKFNSKGEYVSKLGSYGTADGSLAFPTGIAVDPEGNLWVVDNGNYRLEKFASNGEYLAKLGSKGTGDGQFTEASSVAIDPQGTLWVTDPESPCRIQAFFPEGEFVTKFGKCVEVGNSTYYRGITSDSEGNLWVSDNTRMTKWSRGTPYPVLTGAAGALKRTEATLNASVNPQGKATSYQFQYGTTTSFGTSVPISPKSIGSGSTPVKVSEALSGLHSATTYYYHVVATTESSTTYGETRHFTTLAGPGAEAKWRIGGKTFAELGLKEESLTSTGSYAIAFPSLGSTLTCSETATGTLASTGPTAVHMTLKCEIVGSKACKIQPIKMDVNGKFSSLSGNLALIQSEGCGILSSEAYLVNGTGSFDFGTEAAKLNVTGTHTTSWGENPVNITGSSYWQLSGANAGKTFGVW
jgi:streptogramin lyase